MSPPDRKHRGYAFFRIPPVPEVIGFAHRVCGIARAFAGRWSRMQPAPMANRRASGAKGCEKWRVRSKLSVHGHQSVLRTAQLAAIGMRLVLCRNPIADAVSVFVSQSAVSVEQLLKSKGQSRQAVSRAFVNLLLDAMLTLNMVVLVMSSSILRFVFPRPTMSKGWRLWGLDYDAWSDFQFVTFCVILLGVVIHLMLHWNWVCCIIATRVFKLKGAAGRPDEGSQTLYGVATLIAVLTITGAILVAANLSIRSP